jgi:hypothetical protein
VKRRVFDAHERARRQPRERDTTDLNTHWVGSIDATG